MSKAARNRRRRQAERQLRRRGFTGPLQGAAALSLLEQETAQTLMPCRATFLDDPLFGGRAVRVTGVTPEGDLITALGSAPDVPVMLFEPEHILALQDTITEQTRDGRIDALVSSGWHRMPPGVMAGLPADGWGLYRTGGGVQLCDPYAGIFAEGRPDLDRRWLSAADRTGSVMVFFGPFLGVRIPAGRSPRTYTGQDRAREFADGRRKGLLAAASVRWHAATREQTATWVLLAENLLGLPLPPAVYVPAPALKSHGGPLGLARLAGLGRGPLDIPVTRQLAARLTATDVDLIRPGDDSGAFTAGYSHPGGPDDPLFITWRTSAARHGHILVIAGTQDLLPDPVTSPAQILAVIQASRGALTPLTLGGQR